MLKTVTFKMQVVCTYLVVRENVEYKKKIKKKKNRKESTSLI